MLQMPVIVIRIRCGHEWLASWLTDALARALAAEPYSALDYLKVDNDKLYSNLPIVEII